MKGTTVIAASDIAASDAKAKLFGFLERTRKGESFAIT
jgi:hypothetical protein